MAATAQERTLASVSPFGIEADHPRNCDLLIQSIPGCRMRSAIDAHKGFVDRKGQTHIPQDQIMNLGGLPKLPGMQLHVNPDKLTYKIIDPLRGNEELCGRIRQVLKQKFGTVADKIDGVPTLEGKLDPHRMKTLVREMFRLVESKEAFVVRGELPNMDQIEELNGKFLLNPGSQIGTTQPIYEEGWDEWVAQLSRSGG